LMYYCTKEAKNFILVNVQLFLWHPYESFSTVIITKILYIYRTQKRIHFEETTTVASLYRALYLHDSSASGALVRSKWARKPIQHL
jgi:hypothetical protein